MAATIAKYAPRVIFSGIQPTGIPHIGNHLGALSQWQTLVQQVSTQSPEARDQLFFSVVGLHALTVPQDPSQLRQERRDMFAVLLALGLDSSHATVFHQDQVSQHAELAWYLNCVTPVNRLMRMTSWKSKMATLRNANSEDEVDDSLLQLGLLAYPVLQTADVLLYKTTHVPVGDDQAQHLELARDTAQSWNARYPGARKDGKKGKGKGVFRIPEVMLTEHPRIQSLRNPLQKMSKSSPNASSKILLTDTPSEITSKIKSAVTDSLSTSSITWDPEHRPGIAGLLRIHSGYSGENIESLAKRFEKRGVQDLKAEVTQVVVEALRGFREEFARIRGETGWLMEREKEGAEKAREVAERTMKEVRGVVGTD
ncbi:tryptophanyl-tRNA synthetase [Microbotryum lychnidis-dioicae p1A1 Lamole]|uniref:tryptophan--tRNA ligase n=1 Tax=Microbotryum lychnidis-dioicae (strain p1A1 Lamole / MvSl-1064) TaxID=683840 RepID=U5H320_USTV1|nr:tryptophanyl-tRNA synthetase [Microbotryum lychnidis-dioicae p1A1 Lamole]|eukprot:KDE08046.1 tryptophanyl-tRNA synthetase [Microbotryum lychnidis-dioicae p1A1 Lamole]